MQLRIRGHIIEVIDENWEFPNDSTEEEGSDKERPSGDEHEPNAMSDLLEDFYSGRNL